MFNNLAKEIHILFPQNKIKQRTISIEVTNKELEKLYKDMIQHFNFQTDIIYSGKDFGIENAKFASIITPLIKNKL